jgi:hypothetical protein
VIDQRTGFAAQSSDLRPSKSGLLDPVQKALKVSFADTT